MPDLTPEQVQAQLAAIGMVIGRMVGRRFGKAVELLGGLALVALGLAILLEHLGVLGA